MPPPTKKDYQRRLDDIAGLFTEIVDRAQDQIRERCPYRTAEDRCSAKFGCANRRPAEVDGEAGLCAHDGTFDFQSAWDSRPGSYDKAKRRIGEVRRQAADRRAEAATDPAETLFDRADERGLKLASSCGRLASCHECIVQVDEGRAALSPPTEAEEFLPEGYRLACQAEVLDADARIAFEPLIRTPRILEASDRRSLPLNPRTSYRGDEVWRDGKRIDDDRGGLYGLAVDLGTTTVVAELVDLETGEAVAVASFENPQRFGGSDVMHRISYDGGPFNGELRKAVVNALKRELEDLCQRFKIHRRQLYEIVVAGNSTMRDLLFGLDVQPIGQTPYKSTTELEFLDGSRDSTAVETLARRLGIGANPRCLVQGLPLVASHVGADAAASLLALDLSPDAEKVSMLVDIGTNTEIVLAGRGRMLVASCPAGPAFEGGLVDYGMAAYDGAIERVGAGSEGSFAWRTIGGRPPVGICGSGLIDLLALLRRQGRMDEIGRLLERGRNTMVTVAPVEGITLSARDISHLAQAKAASQAGQLILLRRFGIAAGDIDRLYLAGGFANRIDITNAVDIGLLAPVPADRVVKAGNTALQGAREALLDQRRRGDLEKLVRRAEHVELEREADFFDIFVEGCQFKPMPAAAGGADA
ncbi:MAG: ASKHA domain-containing protein [Alphaproteobacteria bacterium]|nr:ASKHA domain-containing protein [Alphaproteobacteria bacterium]MDP6815010.1 ASKHA domain-containing protein [Alphaproteobacteria bacterium]